MNHLQDSLFNSIKVTSLAWSWVAVVILSLIIVILILTWLLIKREKALQLTAFSFSPVGLKLSYELNKDIKLETLALENIALQNEVKALQTKVKKERWQSIGLLILMLVILAISKFKFNKRESIPIKGKQLNRNSYKKID